MTKEKVFTRAHLVYVIWMPEKQLFYGSSHHTEEDWEASKFRWDGYYVNSNNYTKLAELLDANPTWEHREVRND